MKMPAACILPGFAHLLEVSLSSLVPPARHQGGVGQVQRSTWRGFPQRPPFSLPNCSPHFALKPDDTTELENP
jgi:hypothetical protein